MSMNATAQKDPSAFANSDKGRVKAVVDGIEALEKAKAAIAAQIAEAYKAAEADGYSRKRLTECVRRRKRRWKATAAALNTAQLEFDLYWDASGGDDAATTEIDDDVPVMDRGERSFN